LRRCSPAHGEKSAGLVASLVCGQARDVGSDDEFTAEKLVFGMKVLAYICPWTQAAWWLAHT
jgi:hypothetical protein